MKRNMELVRDLLMSIEQKTTFKGLWCDEYQLDGYESDDITKHLIIMAEAGFIVFEAARSSTNPDRLIKVFVFDLSWKGHEYLDTIRDPEVWRKTKNGAKKIGGASFELIIDIAKSLAVDALKNSGLILN